MEANMVDHVNYHRSPPDHVAHGALWITGVALALVVLALMLTAFPRVAAIEHPTAYQMQQAPLSAPVMPLL
jgi:hypothetical protein